MHAERTPDPARTPYERMVPRRAQLKRIEDIKVGDRVWAWDEAQGKLVFQRVRQLFRRENQRVLDVTCISGDGTEQTITGTTEHPFWVEGRGWVPLSNLKIGDRLKPIDGDTLVHVLGIRDTGRTEDVFNFEVEGAHNYFVGRDGVLVHNASKLEGDDSLPAWMRGVTSPDAPISDRAYAQLDDWMQARTGVRLGPNVRPYVEQKVPLLARTSGYPSADAYVMDVLQKGGVHDETKLIDAVAVHTTFFFREPKHFDFLAQLADRHVMDRPYRVWSAASSSGQEVFSAGMVIATRLGEKKVELVGTDLSPSMIAEARDGIYTDWEGNAIPFDMRQRYTERHASGAFSIRPELRSKARFEEHNLINPLPSSLGMFDAAFLMNVLYHLNEDAASQVVRQVADRLVPDGHLFTSPDMRSRKAVASLPQLAGTGVPGVYKLLSSNARLTEPAGSLRPVPEIRSESALDPAGTGQAHSVGRGASSVAAVAADPASAYTPISHQLPPADLVFVRGGWFRRVPGALVAHPQDPSVLTWRDPYTEMTLRSKGALQPSKLGEVPADYMGPSGLHAATGMVVSDEAGGIKLVDVGVVARNADFRRQTGIRGQDITAHLVKAVEEQHGQYPTRIEGLFPRTLEVNGLRTEGSNAAAVTRALDAGMPLAHALDEAPTVRALGKMGYVPLLAESSAHAVTLVQSTQQVSANPEPAILTSGMGMAPEHRLPLERHYTDPFYGVVESSVQRRMRLLTETGQIPDPGVAFASSRMFDFGSDNSSGNGGFSSTFGTHAWAESVEPLTPPGEITEPARDLGREHRHLLPSSRSGEWLANDRRVPNNITPAHIGTLLGTGGYGFVHEFAGYPDLAVKINGPRSITHGIQRIPSYLDLVGELVMSRRLDALNVGPWVNVFGLSWAEGIAMEKLGERESTPSQRPHAALIMENLGAGAKMFKLDRIHKFIADKEFLAAGEPMYSFEMNGFTMYPKLYRPEDFALEDLRQIASRFSYVHSGLTRDIEQLARSTYDAKVAIADLQLACMKTRAAGIDPFHVMRENEPNPYDQGWVGVPFALATIEYDNVREQNFNFFDWALHIADLNPAPILWTQPGRTQYAPTANHIPEAADLHTMPMQTLYKPPYTLAMPTLGWQPRPHPGLWRP